MKTKDIAEYLGEELIGNGEIEINAVASIEKANANEIAFSIEAKLSSSTKASCLIVSQDFESDSSIDLIKVKDPKLAFAKIASILHPPKKYKPQIHQTAVISESAKIGDNAFIGAFCYMGENAEIGDNIQMRAGAKVGDNVKIGDNCVLHPNVFIDDNCQIGDNVILHTGVVVGTDGFGYVRDENKQIKFPQIGKVIIEDNVEIGANTCIDRGALGETRIGEGTKIDNLVQVAHNVQIGKRVVIAAQTGISGSVTIEDDCVIAGQVGFADHTVIKKGAVIGAKSAVFPGKVVRKGYWSGIPVMPMNDYKKLNAHIKSLPRLREEIKKLKEKIKNSE